MLQSHSFPNTRVLRAPPEQKGAMLASAEGTSGENLEHPTRVLRKSIFCTTTLGKSAQNTEYFKNAPKSFIYEYVGFVRASRTTRKRCRERRRRERRKSGVFYASCMQKYVFVPSCLANSAQKTECFQSAPKSLIYEYVGFTHASRTKTNDAREHRRRERRKIGTFQAILARK